jgi:hypothetical protein
MAVWQAFQALGCEVFLRPVIKEPYEYHDYTSNYKVLKDIKFSRIGAPVDNDEKDSWLQLLENEADEHPWEDIVWLNRIDDLDRYLWNTQMNVLAVSKSSL